MMLRLYFMLNALSARVLWVLVMILVVLYHTVGERLGMPHGFEQQLELFAGGLAPATSADNHRHA